MSVWPSMLANINSVEPYPVRAAGFAPAVTSACTTASGPNVEAWCRALHKALFAVLTLCWPRRSMMYSSMAGFLR